MGQSSTALGTSIVRVIPDDKVPDAIKTGLQKALLLDEDAVEYILEEIVNGIGVRAERMYEFARSDRYAGALPSGQFVNATTGAGEVAAQLEEIEGGPIVMDYVHYSGPNTLHMAWMQLVAMGYNEATNELPSLSALRGHPAYLEDMVVFVPDDTFDTIDPETIQQWGTAANSGFTPSRSSNPATRHLVRPSPIQVDASNGPERALVRVIWRTTGGTVLRDSFTITIPVDEYSNNYKYFHAKYYVDGEAKYWMYRDGAGTYPVLDALFDRPPETNGEFFPFAYFRYGRQSVISDPPTEIYQSSKKLVRYLGMNFDQVSEGIEANPDASAIEQAILMFAVPASTTNPLEQRYLWQFFNNMFYAQDVENQHRSEEEQLYKTGDTGLTLQTGQAVNRMIIQDDLFKLALQHGGIYKKRVAGSIGPVGSYTMVYAPNTIRVTVTVQGPSGPQQQPRLLPMNRHHYRYQISTGIYEEITLLNLQTVFHYNDYLAVTANGVDKILLIPLDHSITEDYTIPERERLYSRSLHLVFNCIVQEQLDWYETEDFQLVLVVVMFALTIYSAGQSWQGLVAAFTSAGFAGAAVYLLMLVLKYLIVGLVVKLFVREVGVKATFIIAIIAAAYGIYEASNTGSLAGNPFASELLSLSNSLLRGINVEVRSEMEQLANEKSEFEQYRDEQLKTLETAKELLESNNRLSPFLIFGETPKEYYERTVHSGNIGIVGIDAISVYVEGALRLPKLNDTFSGVPA